MRSAGLWVGVCHPGCLAFGKASNYLCSSALHVSMLVCTQGASSMLNNVAFVLDSPGTNKQGTCFGAVCISRVTSGTVYAV